MDTSIQEYAPTVELSTLTFNSDLIYWGLAFFYAYKAYGGDTLLSSAISAWTDVYNNAFISDADVSSGAGAGTAGRNVSYAPPSGCTDSTLCTVPRFQAKND